jgi:putative hydrolase of the HAD superfamily
VIRGVLLDVDDTLVDTRSAFAAGIAHVVARWLPHLDAAARGAALRHWVADAEGHFRAYTRGEIDLVEQRRRRVGALHAAFGGPVVDSELFEAWDAAFEEAFRAAWRPCPDAPRLLDVLDAYATPASWASGSIDTGRGSARRTSPWSVPSTSCPRCWGSADDAERRVDLGAEPGDR